MTRKKIAAKLYWVGALAWAFGLFARHGQAAEGITDESAFLNDLPVVLSASRLSQPLRDAPGAVSVLDRTQIRASGLRDTSELLRLVPGFVATLAYGSYPAAGYHGLTRDRSNRMLVLIDGRSAYSPYFLGGIEWNQLGVDIDDIERIEVFRGSNSATYGANAFLGVINITTRNAHTSETFSFSRQQGDEGIRDTSAAATLKVKDLGLRLRAREQRDDGFNDFFDGRRMRLADLRGDYQISNTNSLEFHAGANHADIARGYATEVGDPPRWQRNNLSYGLMRYRHTEDTDNEWAATYYHQRETGKDSSTLVSPLFLLFTPVQLAALGLPSVLNLLVDAGFTATRDDIELQHNLTISPTTRAVYGFGWRQDVLNSPSHFNTLQSITTQNLRTFGNLEWHPSRDWTVNSGAMIENTSLSGTNAAPRVAVNYHLDEAQTVRFAWSRAYRTPTPYEAESDTKYTYNGVVLRWTDKPASNLKPEKITAIELGYLGEWRKHNVLLDVRVFDEKLEGLIEDLKVKIRIPQDQIDPTRDEVRTSVNGSWARLSGLEYQLMWRPGQNSWISLTQTFMNIRSNQPKNLQSAPHVATVISATHRFGDRVNVSLTHYRYGKMNWQQTEQETISPYHRTDLRIGYELQAGKSRGELFIVGQNLGQSNTEFKPRYEADARVFAGIRWEY